MPLWLVPTNIISDLVRLTMAMPHLYAIQYAAQYEMLSSEVNKPAAPEDQDICLPSVTVIPMSCGLCAMPTITTDITIIYVRTLASSVMAGLLQCGKPCKRKLRTLRNLLRELWSATLSYQKTHLFAFIDKSKRRG